MPRSSTGAIRNGSPDGSNVTILVTVVTLLLTRWIQCHDPRNSREIIALWLSGLIQGHDPRNCHKIIALRFDATIARKGRQNNASGWIQCHDPRNCRHIIAPPMDPMSRSS